MADIYTTLLLLLLSDTSVLLSMTILFSLSRIDRCRKYRWHRRQYTNICIAQRSARRIIASVIYLSLVICLFSSCVSFWSTEIHKVPWKIFIDGFECIRQVSYLGELSYRGEFSKFFIKISLIKWRSFLNNSKLL